MGRRYDLGKDRIWPLVLSLALPLLNLKLRDTMDFWQVSGILNGLSAIIICFLASLARAESRFGQVLAAFGRYSAAMFMFHPFLYTYVPKLIYWPGEALLCYLVFFLLSLLFSIAIGLLKKVCAYDRAFSSLRLRIEARVNI